MISLLTNLTKAAVAVAVTPVAVVADILTLPASAEKINGGPFDKTAATINMATDAFKRAVK